MKHLLLIMTFVFSNFAFANVHVNIDLETNGKMSGFSSDVKLDKKQFFNSSKDNLKVEYTLSNKRPSSYPVDFEWTEESISLTAKIIDTKKNQIVATPEVATIYGETAVIEMTETDKKNTPIMKISFKATKKISKTKL